MEKFDQALGRLLAPVVGRPADEIVALLELPGRPEKGDRALPCFRFAKDQKLAPAELAAKWQKEIASSLPPEFDRVEAAGGYLNFFLRRVDLARGVLSEVLAKPGKYGFTHNKAAPVAVIEFSSPNIAKPFSIGHLRSTNIGAALTRIFTARGWRVIAVNHLGDWGTQFGKLITAYRRWGSADQLREDAILNLYKLYVRYHEEEEKDPSLLDEARGWFAKLEKGDPEAKELWQWFRELSLLEFKRIYEMLGIDFDYYWGESFYTEQMPAILKEIETKGLSRVSDDAVIVDLEKEGLSVSVLQKKDESSLYITRDLAAANYRNEQFHFDRMMYVVGTPQQLHFRQLFRILELLGRPWSGNCEHVAFGHISFGDQGMSTRKGNVVFLTDVLDRAMQFARKIVEEKNPDLNDKERVARDVGLGAILFADLSSKRIKDVKFNWEEMLSFDGETGPYLQYALVRTKSLVRRYGKKPSAKAPVERMKSDEEAGVVRHLALFPSTLALAERDREPFVISQYLIELAKAFNRFYSVHRILDGPEEQTEARMTLVAAVSDVLETGLKLLGIPILEEM